MYSKSQIRLHKKVNPVVTIMCKRRRKLDLFVVFTDFSVSLFSSQIIASFKQMLLDCYSRIHSDLDSKFLVKNSIKFKLQPSHRNLFKVVR